MTLLITEDVATRLTIKRLILFCFIASVLANCLLACVLLFRTDTTRTVVLSPRETERYTAMSETVSANLLERFSVDALNLILTMTPATGSYQAELFLRHVAPESYGALSTKLRSGVEELVRNAASTAFYPTETKVFPEEHKVCVKGERKTFIGKSVTSSATVALCLTNVVRNGRLMVRSVNEVSDLDYLEAGKDRATRKDEKEKKVRHG